MKNKTEEVKQVHRLIDELEALSGFNDVTINKFAELRVLVNGITPTNTEQIKKEDKRSAKQFDLACRAIDGIYEIADMETEKILRKYFKDVDKLNKQYLEKGQND